jgi:hypothetical protein
VAKSSVELLSVADDAEGDVVVTSNAATVSVDATADEENSCDHAPTVLAVAPELAVTTAVLLASHASAEPVKNGARAMPPSRGDQTAPPLIAGYRVEI